MRDAAPTTIYLKDYTPFGYCVEHLELEFTLHPTKTRVKSRIAFRPNPETADREFFLHGEQLKLIDASIDGERIDPQITDAGLTYDAPDAPFTFEAEVEINPQANTALEGLYMSNGMYCTQCEAEGFRKITYYPDRPDVMGVFTVRINAPQDDVPVLLSNGNSEGMGSENPATHFALWHDPWPKPAYLFALVAGHLISHDDSFVTASGKHVKLAIWVRPGDEHKCAFAMDALKRSMRWDEEVYGREYDLDEFNIVAVDDFNMGAMENKGLNVFNSSAVLASPETSTDMNFERIEAIVAHEYFHNWTGNRITCRDWFQLCLKEGLTVFRDAEFTADMRSAPVKRIQDAIDLRARQFPEDQGPLAHPVRPESFQEINNFYTATVYEKGAEVIAMLKRLVGDAAYRKALDLYFERHDGQACTIEDWLKVFEDTTGRDLSQFKRWYTQAGTPHVVVKEDWMPKTGTYTLTFTQNLTASPTTPAPEAHVIPINVGLLNDAGDEVVPTTLLEINENTQSFSFDGLAGKPVPSLLRDFSAPVVLDRKSDSAERAFLLAHDTDSFTRWDAGRALARATLTDMATDDAAPDAAYLDGMLAVLRDNTLDPAYRALMLGMPGQSDLAGSIAQAGLTPDPMRIWHASETLKQALAQHCQDVLTRVYAEAQVDGPYRPDADQSGKRALAGATLSLLTRLDGGTQAQQQYSTADNMTVQLSALSCLLSAEAGEHELSAFYTQWQADRLVMDKWFMLQVACANPAKTASVTKTLTAHPDFNWKNPNRFRSTLGAFAMNHAGFHADGGAGYELLADWLIRLDPVNPQTTARMSSAFQTWTRYDADRQDLMRAAMERIMAQPDLSRDTSEMIGRILSA